MEQFYNLNFQEFHSAKSNFASMKHSFFLKDYQNKNGKSQIYLNLYIHQQRKKIPLKIFVHKKYWNKSKQEVHKSYENAVDYNLLLRDIEAKINKIEIQFRLSNQILTVDKCAELLQRPDLTVDFIAFMEYEMSLKSMEENSLKNHNSVLKKLKSYRPNLLFADVNEAFIAKYRRYLANQLGNQEVTIDSNIKVIKHYIKLAKKRGIILNIDIEQIKIRYCYSDIFYII